MPLDASRRAFFEPRFGHDFSRVRIHDDAEAWASARIVNARSYTVGHHIVFGGGEYEQGSTGDPLLAHELAHVLQQEGTEGETAPGGRVPRLQRQSLNGAAVGPTFSSGSISITEKPLSVVQTGGTALASAMEFTISKPFYSQFLVTGCGTSQRR